MRQRKNSEYQQGNKQQTFRFITPEYHWATETIGCLLLRSAMSKASSVSIELALESSWDLLRFFNLSSLVMRPKTPFSSSSSSSISTIFLMVSAFRQIQDLARSMCHVLGQNTLFSQCISPPRSINGSWWIVMEAWWNAGSNLAFNGLASHKHTLYPHLSWAQT